MRGCGFAFPTFCGLSNGGHSNSGVPSSAAVASRQIQTAVRTALASGKRRLCVDLLIAAVDVRARTYDEEAAEAVFSGLVKSVQPVLPGGGENLHVVVSGATTALRIQTWLNRGEYDGISVTVLGMDAKNRMVSNDSTCTVGGLLIINPSDSVNSLIDLRSLLKEAHNRGLPVVIHNHPRPDAIYELLGYGGAVPIEMSEYETVFALAPFSLKPRNLEESDIEAYSTNAMPPPPRFALMRQFPSKWALWHFVADSVSHPELDDATATAMSSDGKYVLCAEFAGRPDDQDVMEAITERMSSLNR